MKANRIFLLGFAAAVVGLALTFEAAEAQCWTCGEAGMFLDGEWVTCDYCSGDVQGAAYCGVSECKGCWALGPCQPIFTLDGRSIAPEAEAAGSDDLGAEGELLATFASMNIPPVLPGNTQLRRSCDGGIISRWYSTNDLRAARDATAHLWL